ncbi:MAG: co-chaperone GroES [Clostridia bacterium]|nr:co-chaperone GroES [Clostridia bacterium]
MNVKGGKKVNYQPIFDRVIAVEVEKNKITESGISLSNQNEGVKKAEIIAVGEGIFEEGVFVQMKVKIGDKILFESHCCVPFFDGCKKFLLLKQTDILAVEKDK